MIKPGTVSLPPPDCSVRPPFSFSQPQFLLKPLPRCRQINKPHLPRSPTKPRSTKLPPLRLLPPNPPPHRSTPSIQTLRQPIPLSKCTIMIRTEQRYLRRSIQTLQFLPTSIFPGLRRCGCHVCLKGRQKVIHHAQANTFTKVIPSLLTALQPVSPFAQFAPVSFEFPVEHNEQALVCCQAVIHEVGILCDGDVGA
jgi:hypothetical protein